MKLIRLFSVLSYLFYFYFIFIFFIIRAAKKKDPLAYKFIHMFFKLIKDSFKILKRGHPLILAASTAFFATFSISPTIIVLVNVFSLYFKAETITKELIDKISLTLGARAGKDIEGIVQNFTSLKSNQWITFGGFIFLVFVATTLLRIMQQSIHILWHISYKPINNFPLKIFERLKALAVLLVMGILFILSLFLDASVTVAQEYLKMLNEYTLSTFIWILNVVFSVFVITVWFAILFKILPDARVAWKVAFRGGMLTATCTYLGRLLLGKILVQGNISTIFGASTSFALILLFIFYSSFIIYFGAAFTYVYGKYIGCPIIPDKNTDSYEEVVIS